MRLSSKNKIPLRRALWWIFGTTLGISGAFCLFILIHHTYLHHQLRNDTYQIKFLRAVSKDKNKLPPAYFAELLNLSIDQPSHLIVFDEWQANKVLQSSPVILNAALDKRYPNLLSIQYALRKPFAVISDFTNTLVDEEGIYIPAKPFYEEEPPLKICLGLKNRIGWGERVPSHLFKIAKNIYSEAQEKGISNLEIIDLSRITFHSAGKREIIVTLNNQGKRCVLRLNLENIWKQLQHYREIRDHLEFPERDCVIDLRIPQLAFLGGYD